MDVMKALRELYSEKKLLDEAIALLEARLRPEAEERSRPKGRRGRRSMETSERLEVSRRMSRYWAARRAASKGKSAGDALASPPLPESKAPADRSATA